MTSQFHNFKRVVNNHYLISRVGKQTKQYLSTLLRNLRAVAVGWLYDGNSQGRLYQESLCNTEMVALSEIGCIIRP